MNPATPLNAVTGIGPKYNTLLRHLNLYTVKDLLYYFPNRYQDYSRTKKIVEIIPNEIVTISATLLDIQNIFTKNRKKLTKSLIKDETGEMYIIWFNQHFLKKSLKVGEKYVFSGKVQLFDRKPTLMAPTVEKSEEGSLNTGRLVPIYSETAGLTSKWLRSKINDVLSTEIQLEEIIPDNILKKENFPYIKEAIKQIHFPQNIEEANIAKNRFAFEELFFELLKVEHRKKLWKQELPGIPMEYKQHTKSVERLEQSLPFTLTPSQKTAITGIFSDLSKKHPMNRLIEGDVGSGKTIVAVFSAYLSYLNGFKTLYMAPTEILAQQHYQTFKTILQNFNVTTSLKTSSSKNSDFADITIGTHALLFSKDPITDLGLVIIDEQHRFGVEQRSTLARLVGQDQIPNVLTMTATPIPRTLTLTVYGDLAISVLTPPESKLRNVKTLVVPDTKREQVFNWLKQQNKPIFIVCPLIEQSEAESLLNVKSATAEFQKLKTSYFNNVEIGLLHGKLKPVEKQEIIEKFRTGEIKVLVSTPVIEVGIDIPDASIIVIESAERYGLASLHQLRGRVGRDGKPAHCILFMSNYSKTAYTRLKHLENITDGLELAEIDLKLRGSGDLYGTLQSGYKQFKLADLSDLKNLEKVKLYAQTIYNELEEYPKLNDYLAKKEHLITGAN